MPVNYLILHHIQSLCLAVVVIPYITLSGNQYLIRTKWALVITALGYLKALFTLVRIVVLRNSKASLRRLVEEIHLVGLHVRNICYIRYLIQHKTFVIIVCISAVVRIT